MNPFKSWEELEKWLMQGHGMGAQATLEFGDRLVTVHIDQVVGKPAAQKVVEPEPEQQELPIE